MGLSQLRRVKGPRFNRVAFTVYGPCRGAVFPDQDGRQDDGRRVTLAPQFVEQEPDCVEEKHAHLCHQGDGLATRSGGHSGSGPGFWGS